jgi:tryptophan synthase beta chain
MVRQFHRVIGDEAYVQCNDLLGTNPDFVVACVGGGSNAMGIFSGFVDTPARLIGVEPAGGAAVGRGQPGVVHGMKSYLMQDEHGQVAEAHSISAGLDYPGVGPEHSYLASIGRSEYPTVTDDEVISAFQVMSTSRRNYSCSRMCTCHGMDHSRGSENAGQDCSHELVWSRR